MSYRIAVWSTGLIGCVAIRAIACRPGMELVGVGVHSPGKAGKDPGPLAGIAPLGLATTTDIEELIALKPDCIAYAGPNHARPRVIDQVVRFLEAGINVATSSFFPLQYPPVADAVLREQVAAAAHRGGASFFANGIDPGFATDHLPLVLATMSETISSIRVQEIFRYDGYPHAATIKEGMGFGMPLDYDAPILRPSTQESLWGPTLHKVAARLGYSLDEVHCTSQRRLTERDLEVACGTIPAGTVGAMRFETIGLINGRAVIVGDHVNRMSDDLAPDWPTANRNGTYRVIIEGSPNFTCDLVVGNPETFSADGRIAVCMLMVNAIPYLCEAPPGLLTSLDLPFNVPQGALVASS
jgi:hypothetical protein